LYAAGNPLRYSDPSGEIIPFLVAAVLGGTISGGLDLGTQLLAMHRQSLSQALRCVNWGEVGIAMAGGAVAGLVGLVAFEGTLAAWSFFAVPGLSANIVSGAIAGTVAGQYARLTGLVLSGKTDQIGNVMFRPQDMLLDAVLGGTIAGVLYGEARISGDLRSQSTAQNPMAELPIRAGSSDKTSGILIVGKNKVPLESGWNGPASQMPPGSAGFDIVTRTHVEGHASALMQQNRWTSGTLYVNNPPCSSCTKLLPRMLAPSSTLRVIGPNGYDHIFTGLIP
jgi:hypothetical protein